MENKEETIQLQSKISAVTIYADRALVIHDSKISLPKGSQVLIFDNLPESIEQNSIQVNGKGNAQLTDIKFQRVHYAEIPDKDKKVLFDKKIELEDLIKVIDDKIAQAGKENAFIENIAKKLTEKNEKESSELDPEKWMKMVSFYRSKLENLDTELRDHVKSRRDIANQLNKTIQQINQMGSNPSKLKNQVHVSVEVKEDSDLLLSLSYMVYGPSWHPIYDLRVSTEKKIINVFYNAMVVQNTTEDWNDVQISLSTAQPQIGGQQPELSPWHINFVQPLPRADSRARKSPPAPAMKKEATQMFSAPCEEEISIPDSDEPMAIQVAQAAVETNATSVVFVVNGRNTIKSDNLEHKVTVMIEEFPAQFRYSTVPKLTPFAYLKAKTTNRTDYPLLPGETNVFLDNNFVANSYLNLVSPNEEFWTFLGIDEGIKVEYKFIKKFQKTEGMISKKSLMIYEYLISITNNKKTTEEIVVWDQIPISSNEEIEVKLIEPSYKQNSDNLKKNECNYLEWFFKIEPAKKIEIPLKFSVEYPKDKLVEGL